MKELGKNITYVFLNLFLGNILGIIFWLILLPLLSIDDFGKISYINSLSIFLVNFFSFGVFSALWKYCSENKSEKILFLSFLFSFFISSFLILSFLFLAKLALNFNLVLIVFIFSLVFIFSSYFENILYGFQEFKKIFISNLIFSISKIIFLLTFYFLSQLNVLTAIFSIILGMFIGSIFKFLFSFKYLVSKFKVSFDFSEIKKFFILAFSSFLSSFSSSFFSSILIIFSFIFISSIIAGIIYFSQLIYSIISFLPSILITASLPLISSLMVNNKTKRSIAMIQSLFKLSLIIIIPLTFLISFYLEEILKFFDIHNELIQYSPKIFLIISVSATFFLFSNILFSFLFATTKVKNVYYIEVFTVISFLIISFFIGVEYFLVVYLLVSFLRFLLYSLCSLHFFKNFFNFREFTKITIFCLFSFFIPFFLSFRKNYLWFVSLILSAFSIILLIKILKVINDKDKKFVKSLKLNPTIERIILSIL